MNKQWIVMLALLLAGCLQLDGQSTAAATSTPSTALTVATVTPTPAAFITIPTPTPFPELEDSVLNQSLEELNQLR